MTLSASQFVSQPTKKPKTGKTHFYSTAPGGIGVQSLDFGTEGVIDKFPDTYFDVKEYNFAYDFTIKSRGDEATEQADRIRQDRCRDQQPAVC